MSTLFKIELVLLALGILGSFAGLMRRPGQGCAAALKTWWSGERWLFGQNGAGLRTALAEPMAVGTLFVLYFYDVVIQTACVLGGLSEDLPLWEDVRLWLLILFFVVKTVFATRYTGWQSLILGAALTYFYLLNIITGYRPLAEAAVLIVLLKDVDLRRGLRWVMGFIAADIAVKAALCYAGLIGNQVEVWESGRTRMDLGQGSMNALGILAAQVTVLWVVTRFSRLRWWDVCLGLAGLFFIEEVPNSRSALLFAGLAIAGMLAAHFLPRLFAWKPFQLLCCLPGPAVAAVMWWFHYHYDKDVAWMARLDSLLTGRISLVYITQYEELRFGGIQPFGHVFVTDRFYRVDDSYVYYAYLCGPLMALLLCAGFAFLTWKLLRSGRPELAVCVMAYACYAAMERCLSTINFSLLFLPAVLFGAEALCWSHERRKKPGDLAGGKI